MSNIPPTNPQMYPATVAPVPAPSLDAAPHKEPDDREEVYYEGSPMLRGHFGHMVLYTFIGVVLIIIPILASHFNHPMVWWLILAFVVAGIISMTIPMLLVKRTRYRITNYRIDFERGWLSTTINTIELWHVEDIKFHQNLWDKIVGVGTIEVFSHDEKTPNLYMRSVPHARQLFATLEQRIIAVKRSRGVMKVDTGT